MKTTQVHFAMRMVWLSGALLLGGCRDEAQIRMLGDQIRALEGNEKQRAQELEALKVQIQGLEEERAQLREEREAMLPKVEAAEEALKALQEQFAAYKAQYKLSIRKRAPGMELGLVEVLGKRFEQVRVRQLTEEALIFAHATGTTSVPLSQLKPELQTRLGYEAPVPVMARSAGGLGGGGIVKDGVRVGGAPVAVGGVGGIRKNGTTPMAGGGAAGGLAASPQVNEVARQMEELRELIGGLEQVIGEGEGQVPGGQAGSDPAAEREGAAMLRAQLQEAKAAYAELQKKREAAGAATGRGAVR